MKKIEKLYSKLDYGNTSGGKSKEIIDLYKPESYSEFKNIKGIGESFLTRNIKLIKQIENNILSSGTNINNDPSLKKILLKFKDELVDISTRNKMIYNSKITAKLGLNIFHFDEKHQNRILSSTDNLKNLEGNITVSIDALNKWKKTKEIDEKNQDYYSILFLSRFTKSSDEFTKQSGSSIQYFSPFYLKASIDNNNKKIPVYAPIFLVPINTQINKNTNKVNLSLDDSREIKTNKFINDFFLKKEEVYKFNYEKSLKENLKLMFQDSGIELDFNVNKIKNVSVTEANLSVNKWKVLFSPSIGMFNEYSSQIQVDIDKSLKSNYVNQSLAKIYSNSNIYSMKEKNEIKEKGEKAEKNDDSMYYIDSLNHKQRLALAKINFTDGLTIFGPPGTGKSQTILSLIIDSIIKDKKVLVISEKKEALDVIYKRLGNLNKYSIHLRDNKNDFYDKLNNLFEEIKTSKVNTDEIKIKKDKIKNFSENIDNLLFNLKKLNINLEYENLKLLINESSKINNFKKNYEAIKPFSEYDFSFDFENNFDFSFTKESIEILNDKNYKNLSSYKKSLKIKIDTKNKELKEIIKKINELNKNIKNRKQNELKLKNLYNDLQIYNFFFKKIFNRKKIAIIFNDISEIVEKNISDFLSENELLQINKNLIKKKSKQIINLNTKQINLIKEIKYLNLKLENTTLNEEILIDYDNATNFKSKIWDFIIYTSEKYDLKFIEDNLNKLVALGYLKTLFNDDLIEIIPNYKNIIQEFKNNENYKKTTTNELAEITIKNRTYNYLTENEQNHNIQKILNNKRKPIISKFISKFFLEISRGFPIWFANPEDVSTTFPISMKFDLVIFDEASQVFARNSVSGLMRAKKVIVLGDDKQLSPTSFFLAVNDSLDQDDEFDGHETSKSLLDYAKELYPSIMLEHHYRSKYSELIHFSNQNYYDGKLISMNISDSKTLKPIEYFEVSNPLWHDRMNEPEAEQIIKFIYKCSKNKNYHGKTFGIITMNVKQKDLIDELIQKETMNDLGFRNFIESIDLFVKNIENVQGDERDIIIFSMSYGPNSEGKQSINFGPLQNLDGEKRLNVAITRSKYQMIIFNSMDIEIISRKVKTSKNIGPKHLVDFIKYAKTYSQGNQNLIKKTSNKSKEMLINFESPLEREIYNEIIPIVKSKGLEIETQHEFNSYRLDFVIYDKKTNNYILGIEADGASFHSSDLARIRDIDRQNYLESRGWKIYRIWSTNWWKNPKIEVTKFEKFLNQIIK